MVVALVVIALLVLVTALFAFLVKPAPLPLEWDFSAFERRPIAHRGLFDNESGAPENSLAAFALAVENGYGIELDVQLSQDGQLIVFHDADLQRATGATGSPPQRTLAELQQLPLFASDERIPLFADVLELVGGRVPLVVEIKPEGNWRKACATTAELLDVYEGAYCVESFHPLAMRWFKVNRPDVIRGQLALDFFRGTSTKPPVEKAILSNLLMNAWSRPHFIAYHCNHANQFGYGLCRRLFHPKNVAWTVRDQATFDDCQGTFDAIIFDGFIPKER